MKIFITIILFFSSFTALKAQDTLAVQGSNVLYGLVVDGDTILVTSLEEVYILPRRKFSSKHQMRKYRRLVRNVKKVYPYSQIAKVKFEEVESDLEKIHTERGRKKYMNEVEQELKDEFEGKLKKLTISQGRILIKLIDRELDQTSYDLIKDLKGNFSAFFWQAFARVFGNNLKSTFDAEGEDQLLDEIIVMIENGQL